MLRARLVRHAAVRGAALSLLCWSTARCRGSEGTLLVRAHGGSVQGGVSFGGTSGAISNGGTAGEAAATGGAPATYSPAPGVTWQAQLQGSIDTSLPVSLFYLDPDDAGAATLHRIRSQGDHVVCYLSAGTFESWRADADAFPASAIGNPVIDHPDERWLDFRDPRVEALMESRVRALAAAGCEGIDPSSIDTDPDSGFDIAREDVIEYARWFSATIHAQGMSAGLSTSEELVPILADAFDWALTVDCLSSTGCAGYASMREREHAVLLVEFGDASRTAEVCAAATRLGFDALIKSPQFDAFRVGCKDEL